MEKARVAAPGILPIHLNIESASMLTTRTPKVL